MFTEVLTMAGVALSAVGLGLAWYKHHQDKAAKKKAEDEYSIGQNVSNVH